MWWMLKNTEGKPDAILTMLVFSFVTVLVKLLVMGMTLNIGTKEWNAGTLDAGIITALMAPLLAAYCARRYTDKRIDADVKIADAANITALRMSQNPVTISPSKGSL